MSQFYRCAGPIPCFRRHGTPPVGINGHGVGHVRVGECVPFPLIPVSDLVLVSATCSGIVTDTMPESPLSGGRLSRQALVGGEW